MVLLILALMTSTLRPEATATATINDIVQAVREDKPGLCFAHSVVLVGLLERLGYRSAMMGLFNSDGDMYHAYVATQDFGNIDIFPEANPTPDLIGQGVIIQHIYYDKVKNSFEGDVDKVLTKLIFALITRKLNQIELALKDKNYTFILDALKEVEYLVHCDTPIKMELEDKILNKLVPFGAYLKRNGDATERTKEAFKRLKGAVSDCYRDWIGYRPRDINRLFDQAA